MEIERIENGVAKVSLTSAELGRIYMGLCEVEQHDLADQVGDALDEMGVSPAELHDAIGSGPNLPRVMGERTVRLGGTRVDKILSPEAMEELTASLAPRFSGVSARRRRKRTRLA